MAKKTKAKKKTNRGRFAGKKMLKMSDQEVLKHIICYDAPPDVEKEPHLRKLWERAFASEPTFIKAEVAVDHTMSKRKRAVINKRRDLGASSQDKT
jgi:hypothetical protein